MAIQKLEEQVIAQIAAGEVVERPASVVKELVENSLDAGASTIHVVVNGGGRRLIRISDDGHGIPADEVELAFARHATSKLQTADDLEHILTLGFRGEALASIAAVSRVTIATRHRDADAGIRMRMEGGTLVFNQPIGASIGTIISVENLFFNTPARLKFQKSEMTEKRQIATIITRYAMAYPQVRFLLEQDGVEIFRSNGSGRLADVVVQALGLDNFKQMIEVDARPNADGISLVGFTSSPDLNRADRSRITLFVNGRWVQDNSLTFAVTQAYHTLLMNGRFPLSVLMLKLPPQDVDVNVHPTKAEVRFRDANAIFSAVQRGVRRAVIDAAQPPVVRGSYGYGSDSDVEADEQIDLPMPMVDTGQHARQQRGGAVPTTGYESDPTAIPEGPGAPAKPRTLPMLRVLGQISAAYIVAEGPSGMYLIDQHAAHERVLYEQFMDNYERQGLLTQHTLMGQTISLSAPDARLLEAHQETLREFGFVLESFGPNTFAVRSVPAILSDADPADILTQILTDLESGRLPGQKSIEERIIMRVCKQAAVKAGQILSLDEMNGILRQLERCRSPHTCPHGRPTILHMTTDQLAREFGRMG